MSNKNILSLALIIITPHFNAHTQAVFLYSHGIASTYKQAFWYAQSYKIDKKRYHNKRYLFSEPFVTFNFPDATEELRRVKREETSMAQDNEIASLKRAYEKTITHMHECNMRGDGVVLFGISRGASAVINFMGIYNPPEVKALILESPFDSVATIIDSMMQKFCHNLLPHSFGEYLMEFIFKRYKRDGIRPIDVVDQINKNVPILIICSKQDQLVPWYSSVRLYKKLQEAGYNHVYIYGAHYGKHSKILQDKDGETFQAVVHAFCQKYNLPHSPKIARKGKNRLKMCQPSVK